MKSKIGLLAVAAESLGVTEESLKEALGMNNMSSGEPQKGEKPQDLAPEEIE